MLVSFFIVDAHRNEILLRYFGTPNDRSTQVNGQIVYARFFYDRTRARRHPFKELFIQVPFAFAFKRLRFHNRSDFDDHMLPRATTTRRRWPPIIGPANARARDVVVRRELFKNQISGSQERPTTSNSRALGNQRAACHLWSYAGWA